MRSLFRRFGIAALSVALVATLIGSTQAGIIPWVYNVFFGPVGYGPAGYGAPAYPHGYPMTAGYRAAGYGCGPCRTPAQFSCRPSPCSPCSSGSCPTYVSYGPRSSCKTGQEVTGWKSEVTQTLKASDLDRRAPSPVDPAPAPTKTFSDGGSAVTKSADPSEQDSEVAKPATPAVAAEAAPGDINVPAVPVGTPAAPGALTTTGSGDNPGFVTTPPPGSVTEAPDATPAAAPGAPGGSFIPPKPGVVPEEKGTGTQSPTFPEGVLKPAGVDGETSWKLTVPNHRLARRVYYRNAQIARRSVVVDSEYVIPSESVAHIVTRD